MSGQGKTTVSRGLMALYRRKGMAVQPFKCGPDYIDTKFHAAVCGRPSINLDTFMATPQHVAQLFARYGRKADVCVVEGMMGLFDGYDRDRGSSAEIARTLGIPVVLVVDARSAAYSMAALLSGFLHFRDDLNVAGVVFNKVGSERHAGLLRQVCDDLGVACLGCLPRRKELEQGSRYLGLDFTEEAACEPLVQLMETHVDWQRILDEGATDVTLPAAAAADDDAAPTAAHPYGNTANPQYARPRALIARNEEAFSFVYQETIDCFGSVSFFDPEHEVPAFDGVDLLYLPGGYPEKHLDALTANKACREAIKAWADGGGRVVAECGGMMYLCEKMITDDGDYPLCGVLPYAVSARTADRRLSLGYRRFTLDGREYRGHEFHYTQFAGAVPPSAAQVFDARGEPVDSPVFRQGNVLATYVHLGPGGN
jgi:cobyrinic acid a,c-diamide synthase